MVTLGEGEYKYEVAVGWGKLPDGYSFKECAAVGCDADDNVYVFNRGEHPMIVFDAEGNFLRSWGEGLYPRAHGITMSPDGTIFCSDDGDHTVRKCNLDGTVLFTLGVPGTPAQSRLPSRSLPAGFRRGSVSIRHPPPRWTAPP